MAKRKVKFDDDEILMEDNVADQVEQLLARIENLEEENRRKAEEEKDKLAAELNSIKNGDVDSKKRKTKEKKRKKKKWGTCPRKIHMQPMKPQ